MRKLRTGYIEWSWRQRRPHTTNTRISSYAITTRRRMSLSGSQVRFFKKCTDFLKIFCAQKRQRTVAPRKSI